MAMSMGPPQLPGFSLRVQLFSPNACEKNDKPIRCFRVVISPDASVRDFCQEASRIHEINYGETLAIKKCQDDQEFDITQSEILGNLFANTATIRVIKAPAGSSVRDSVPPSSALRFDPTSRKRDRPNSPQINGALQSNSYKPNKRQRLIQLDPDHPLPSRESEAGDHSNGKGPEVNFVPSSQESVILGTNHRYHSAVREVRSDLPQIPETPSPSPPPSHAQHYHSEKYSTNRFDRKPILPNNQSSTRNGSNHKSEVLHSSPFNQISARAQSNQPRAKSTSYHIPRPTERGLSVSTAATSPLSADQQLPRNGIAGPRRQPSASSSGSIRFNHSPHRDIYENIVSEDESAAILDAKREKLRIRKSPNSGLPGLDWANARISTPPNGRRNSGTQDSASATTPGKLPLTPDSKEREARQQRTEADEARKARQAAAEAAEQRKREADEARAAEEQRVAEEERAKREEQERIEIEEFQRNEAERKAKAKERAESENRAAEEGERRKQQERLTEEKQKGERLRQEATRKKMEDEAALERNRALMAEAKLQEAERLQSERLKSHTPDPRHRSPSMTASNSSRRQSSTAFIPNGRKSAMKASSQAIMSSPAPPSLSPEASRSSVGLEAQMPLPKDKARRVSFQEDPPKKDTPILPPVRKILPPAKVNTPIPVSRPVQKTTAPLKTYGSSSRNSTTPIRPPGRSTTQIIPPKSSQSQSSVPLDVSKKSVSPEGAPKIPQPVVSKKITPSLKASPKENPIAPNKKTTEELSSDGESEDDPAETVARTESSSDEESDEEEVPHSKQAESSRLLPKSPAQIPLPDSESGSEADSESGSEDEDDVKPTSNTRASKEELKQITRKATAESKQSEKAETTLSKMNESKVAAKPKPEEQSESEESDIEELEDDNDAASSPSSIRDSHSPVVFSQHPGQVGTLKSKPSESEDDDESEVSESEEESDVEMRDANDEVLISSPKLPEHKPTAKQQVISEQTTETDNTSLSTQAELDQQLTSSMYEAHRSSPPPSRLPQSSSRSQPSSSRPILMKMGASLSQLNSSKAIRTEPKAKPAPFQAPRQELEFEEEEESEEESDDSSEESDEDNATAKLLASAPSRAPRQKPHPVDSDSDTSSSGTTSGSEDEESESAKAKMRNELMKQVARTVKGQSSSQKSAVSIPSSKSGSVVNDKEIKKKVKPRDSYTNNYSFTQPKY